MKRLAICLSVCAAVVGSAATGHARRGGGKAAAPAADDNAGGEGGGDKAAAPAAGGDKEAAGAPASESLDTTDQEPAKVEEEITGPKGSKAAAATLSWQDIVVVPRKAFLKGGRFEFQPFTGVTINDNLIRHYVFGLDINFFLTDAIWVGLQGQYFVKQLETQSELLGLQFNRASTMNRYLYGGAFNMGYVPTYGKFALFNRSIVQWEIWVSGGVGATFTEVLARDPAEQNSKGFKNTALTPNVGIGSRIFLTDWLTVNFAVRDYLLLDKFEPPASMSPECETQASCKAASSSTLVNNVMAYVGVGMYLPTKFTYKTPR